MRHLLISRRNCNLVRYITWLIVVFGLKGICEAESNLTEPLEQFTVPAVKAYLQKNYEEALQCLDKALLVAPDDKNVAKLRAEILLIMAQRLIQSGEKAQAQTYIQKVINSPDNELVRDAQALNYSIDKRPLEGLHGYLSSAFEYDTNVASLISQGNTLPPTNQPGFGSRSGGLMGYQGHLSDDYYWDVWGEAMSLFWKGDAQNLDFQQYTSGVLLGKATDRWDLSLAYKFSADVFDDNLNRLRHGAQSLAKLWVVPNHWQTWLSAGLYSDDFKTINGDATYLEASLQNYIPFYLEGLSDYGYVFGGYTFTDNNAHSVFGYKSHRAGLSFAIPTAFWSLSLQIGGLVEKRIYNQPNPSDRHDTIGIAYTELVKSWKLPAAIASNRLNNNFQTKIGYTYVETQSTVAYFDKTEHIAKFTLLYQF